MSSLGEEGIELWRTIDETINTTVNKSNTLYRNSLTQSWTLPCRSPSLFPKELNNRTLMQCCHLRPAATSGHPRVFRWRKHEPQPICAGVIYIYYICVCTYVYIYMCGTANWLTCKMKMQWFSLNSNWAGFVLGAFVLYPNLGYLRQWVRGPTPWGRYPVVTWHSHWKRSFSMAKCWITRGQSMVYPLVI